MRGHIRTLQRCPQCGGKFFEKPRVGIGCPACKITPTRFYLDIWYDAKRHRIFSDKLGQPISSYDQAFFLHEKINEEISAHRFDPSHWLKGDAKKFLVPDLAARYYEDHKADLAPSWRKYYKTMLTRCADFFAAVDIRETRRIDIKEMTDGLGKIVKGKTLKNHLTTFHAFMEWAKEYGFIEIVPVFPQVDAPEKPPAWLGQEDQIKVFQAVPEPDRPIIAFLMLHGIRPGEARALRIRDVDLAHNSITVSSTWSGTEIRDRRKGRKAKAFVVSIHPEALPFISDRVKGALPGAFLFMNPRTGDPYSTAALKKVWKKVKLTAGVDLRLYDATRHSFASQLVNKGVPLTRVSEYLGHSSTRMTEKFYAHADKTQAQIDMGKISLQKVVKITVSEPSGDKKTVSVGD